MSKIEFMSARELVRMAGKAASDKLPDEVAETTPVPLATDSGSTLLIMFYRVSGRLPQRHVHAPHYAMHIDGQTGHVIKFWPTTAEQLGIKSSGNAAASFTKPAKLTPEQYAEKHERLLAISSRVWGAFAAKSSARAEEIRPLLEEYWTLFGETVLPEVAPFYLEAAPEFFTWLRSAG